MPASVRRPYFFEAVTYQSTSWVGIPTSLAISGTVLGLFTHGFTDRLLDAFLLFQKRLSSFNCIFVFFAQRS